MLDSGRLTRRAAAVWLQPVAEAAIEVPVSGDRISHRPSRTVAEQPGEPPLLEYSAGAGQKDCRCVQIRCVVHDPISAGG